MITLKDIAKKYLIKNKYDGFFSKNCSCVVSDDKIFLSCNYRPSSCVAGYLHSDRLLHDHKEIIKTSSTES